MKREIHKHTKRDGSATRVLRECGGRRRERDGERTCCSSPLARPPPAPPPAARPPASLHAPWLGRLGLDGLGGVLGQPGRRTRSARSRRPRPARGGPAKQARKRALGARAGWRAGRERTLGSSGLQARSSFSTRARRAAGTESAGRAEGRAHRQLPRRQK